MNKHLRLLFRLYKQINDKRGQPFNDDNIKGYIRLWLKK